MTTRRLLPRAALALFTSKTMQCKTLTDITTRPEHPIKSVSWRCAHEIVCLIFSNKYLTKADICYSRNALYALIDPQNGFAGCTPGGSAMVGGVQR